MLPCHYRYITDTNLQQTPPQDYEAAANYIANFMDLEAKMAAAAGGNGAAVVAMGGAADASQAEDQRRVGGPCRLYGVQNPGVRGLGPGLVTSGGCATVHLLGQH